MSTIEPRVKGHHVHVAGYRNGWRAECLCGWKSLPAETGTDATARGAHHLDQAALDLTVEEADQFAREQARIESAARSDRSWRLESLSQADRHITRCPVCGTQTWEGDCATCNTIAMRFARKVVAA